MKDKQNIRLLNKEQIETFFLSNNEKKFRAHQLWEWIWKKNVFDFDKMTNLSNETRNLLKENFYFPNLTLVSQQKSSDKTIKNGFKLFDGNIVEGVLIPTTKRMTACISSQVGCSLSCAFCATGKLNRLRNLAYYEIFFSCFF
jgi:23S rRNA (adenine2503-C2)-methyltransferase